MKRKAPKCLIQILLSWCGKCMHAVRWKVPCLSAFFFATSGVCQGGVVLSPFLFAIYLDDLAVTLRASGNRCHIAGIFLDCILYADDIILLISSSYTNLQKMLNIHPVTKKCTPRKNQTISQRGFRNIT